MENKVKFKDIRIKAEIYSNKRVIKKGETFRRQHETDFIAGYKQALKDINHLKSNTNETDKI